MDDEKVCKNCGARITLTNYALGQSWEHVNGIELTGYQYCRSAVAEPRGGLSMDENPDEVKGSAHEGLVAGVQDVGGAYTVRDDSGPALDGGPDRSRHPGGVEETRVAEIRQRAEGDAIGLYGHAEYRAHAREDIPWLLDNRTALLEQLRTAEAEAIRLGVKVADMTDAKDAAEVRAAEAEAALMEARAEAWDEGLDAGRDRWIGSSEYRENPENPYRAGAEQ